jgi:hypothetical protein
MRRIGWTVVAATAVLALAGFGPWRLGQAAAQSAGAVETAPHLRAHPPARIRVHPLARSYPGPDAVRQCTAWLAPEYRLSGTVIVPKMHCWWEHG